MTFLGATERLRIENPFKVPCRVKISINMDNGANSADAKASKVKSVDKQEQSTPGPAEAFSLVSPDKDAEFTLPCLEHRYVAMKFLPDSLQTYRAVFEAIVEDGHDPKTNKVLCSTSFFTIFFSHAKPYSSSVNLFVTNSCDVQ